MCDRRVVEILLNDNNFLSVVGVFEHNPGLIRRIDFRTALEGNQGFKEVRAAADRVDCLSSSACQSTTDRFGSL